MGRVVTTLLGCQQIVMGVSLGIHDADIRLVLASLAGLMLPSALTRLPRSLFEPVNSANVT